ncbi:protein crumbs isoform X3 [Harmonia axyridis]|uniref:protein crumbs isoform X3 n=1 Tax=Harmonia axyridis TaxID=115357 RepID=UPI001E278127|nr:protein crumbs isoform X3 [Harmonia axyridis]
MKMISSYIFQLITILVFFLVKNAHGIVPYFGPSDQPEAYFNGSSYVRLQTTISLKKQTGISFRTCVGGNLFSQQQNDEIFELVVKKEGMIFFARTSGKTFEERIAGNYTNNRWHTVYLQYTLGNLTITIDDKIWLLANSSYNHEVLTSPGLYNEGAAVLLIGKQFNGCIQEGPSIVFNKDIISSSHNVIFEPCPLTDFSCTPSDQPQGIDICLNKPCFNQGTCINDKTGYTCTCHPRYTGKNCEIDMGDPCEKIPPLCKNNGKCESSTYGEYMCTCPPNYTGEHCENKIVINPQCEPPNNPCLNGGVCSVIDGTNQVICTCKPGFKGTFCDINLDECFSSPCKNGGICVDGFNNYTCNCAHTGYTGRLCDKDVNECLNNPCHNNGLCFNNYGSYLCQCVPGYGGQNCEYNINECQSQPCYNRGICVDKPGGYECRCPMGFQGNNCELDMRSEYCTPQSCLPYGECRSNSNLGSSCYCKHDHPGIYPNCTVDPVCVPNPCRNGGICTGNRLGDRSSFNCSCLPGFIGRLCQVNVDECSSSPCLNGGQCIDKINSYACNCTPDWMGSRCEKPYDACELKPCQNNGTCVLGASKHNFACNCSFGFEGERCEVNIDDCKEVQCAPGKVCVDLVNAFECRCPPGYGGDNCTIDLDPCAREPCSNNGICTVDPITPHHFKCSCPPGYMGEYCDQDIDECTQGKYLCNNGICVNTEGGFQCYCKPGFTGERCNLDFDECLSMPCQNNATCLNKINKYECVCPPGYTGKDCSVNINECDSNPCTMGSTCVDLINAYRCDCQPGLTGINCEINTDDCESSPCLHNSICIDKLNNYTCDCTDTGYEGRHCETNIDDCLSNPCVNDAKCVDLVKGYRCMCHSGYTGTNCEEDINECESNPCQFDGTCLERSNISLYHSLTGTNFDGMVPEIFRGEFNYNSAAGYECVCIAGITGKNCEIDIDECQSSPCVHGKCENLINSYSCTCNDGFEGERCDIDINECEKFHPCVNGVCIDKRADYYCSCEQNYGGKNCSVELVGCTNNPCMNNGTCKPFLYNETEHKFNCSCDNGFYGPTCEKVTTMSLSKNSQIMVNTSREEGYDIQFRFKTTLGDGLLAIGKGFTYYILELSKGRLNLHSSLLNKWEGAFVGSNLNNSEWQRVFVAINSTHLVLSANDEQTINVINFNENLNSSSTTFPITYIGGIPNNLRKLTHSQPFLVGCIEDVLINGEWILPEEDNVNISFMEVDKGCQRTPQCNPNPCKSGGHCTDKWREFSCTCERPYLGNTCQYNFTAATFGYENITDSLVTVAVSDYARRAVRSVVDISMFIKTRQPKGQIFYLGSGMGSSNSIDDTYIAAQLEGGELMVSIQFNGTSESYTVGGVHLDNGYNHLIEVVRNITLVQVKLNGTEYFRKTLPATATLDAQVLFLGGQPQVRSIRQAESLATLQKPDIITSPSAATIAALSSVHFKGIIQDVQISNGSSIMVVEFFPLKVEDLNIPQSFGMVNFSKELVKEGILTDDMCRSKPCLHDGRCEVTWNDYQCHCARGFKGKNCNELKFCEIETCPKGSDCKNLEDGFECIANASFDATSKPLRYSLTILPNSTKSVDQMQITYRTRSWGTVFFAKSKEDYFIVFVYHNDIVVEWNLEGVMDSRKFKKDNFEGQWLTLLLKFKDSTFKGGFLENVNDENPNFEVQNFSSSALVQLLTKGEIFIAGSDEKTFDYQQVIDEADNMTGYIPVDSTTEIFSTNSLESFDVSKDEVTLYKVDKNKKTDKFKGCLGEIRIGGLLLPFFTNKELKSNNHYSQEFYELISETKPEIDCTLCYNSDCFNQGQCISPTETYKCDCPAGYAADDCSIDINECLNNQCQNNAKCVDLVAKYRCDCQVGYEGEHCEIDIDECLSNPCRHGGSCIDLIGTFKCNCPEDFVGKQCEAPLLITCDNKPCKDGATCQTGTNKITGNNFTCICTEGMEGPLCDTPFCQLKDCENEGECNTEKEVPFCNCKEGFDGKYCENNINDCVLPSGESPCQNGGVCIDGINQYKCNCTGTGFRGPQCETDIDECEDPLACGKGMCHNIPGNFKCTCLDPIGKCGHGCILDDPCFGVNPCVHGDCTSDCSDKPAYKCRCRDSYIGVNCTEYQLAASAGDGGFNILYVAVPLVLIVFIGLAIGLVILVNVARSKRATRGTYSPSAQEFCNPRVELDHVLKPPPEERLI